MTTELAGIHFETVELELLFDYFDFKQGGKVAAQHLGEELFRVMEAIKIQEAGQTVLSKLKGVVTLLTNPLTREEARLRARPEGYQSVSRPAGRGPMEGRPRPHGGTGRTGRDGKGGGASGGEAGVGEEGEEGNEGNEEAKTSAMLAEAEAANLRAKLLVAQRQVLVLQGQPLPPPPYRECDTVEEAVIALATEMGVLAALEDVEAENTSNLEDGGGHGKEKKKPKPPPPLCQFFKPEVFESRGEDPNNPHVGLPAGEFAQWAVRYVQPAEAALYPYPTPHDNHGNGTQNEVGRPYFADKETQSTQWAHPVRPDWQWPPPAEAPPGAGGNDSDDEMFDPRRYAASGDGAVAFDPDGAEAWSEAVAEQDEKDSQSRMGAWALVQGGGIIEIVVYEAKGLKELQNGGMAMSPYVKMQVAGCVVPCRSRVVKNGGAEPVWCPLPHSKYIAGASTEGATAAAPTPSLVPAPPSSSASSSSFTRAPAGGRKQVAASAAASVALPESGRMPAPVHYGSADCAITFELRRETLMQMVEPPLLLLEIWNKSFHTKDGFVGHAATAWVQAAVSQEVQVVNLTDLQGAPAGQVAVGIQVRLHTVRLHTVRLHIDHAHDLPRMPSHFKMLAH
jgi:hypothetical protein